MESGDAVGETPAQGLGLSWSEGRDVGFEERRPGQEPDGKSEELTVSIMSLLVGGARRCCEWGPAAEG